MRCGDGRPVEVLHVRIARTVVTAVRNVRECELERRFRAFSEREPGSLSREASLHRQELAVEIDALKRCESILAVVEEVL